MILYWRIVGFALVVSWRAATPQNQNQQSRYYDRIIRDTAEMNRIAEYIENNVAEWDANKDIDYQIK